MESLKNVIGENPSDIINNQVKQDYNDTCAIKSQQLVLDDFGIHLSEDQLIKQAETLNIYSPGAGGTSPADVGKLLELNGIECTQYENATIFDLTSALAKGEKVIIGVDSDELWYNNNNDSSTGEQANHALIVAGIDTTDPANVQVILTDPGTGQEGARYPLPQFLDAWHDSGNFMVATNSPAPLEYNPEMINFDYSAGHLPAIGPIPYDYFNDTLLYVAQHVPLDISGYDMLFNDFDQMLDGDIMTMSPDFIHTMNQIPDFADSHHPDLSHSFHPYTYQETGNHDNLHINHPEDNSSDFLHNHEII